MHLSIATLLLANIAAAAVLPVAHGPEPAPIILRAVTRRRIQPAEPAVEAGEQFIPRAVEVRAKAPAAVKPKPAPAPVKPVPVKPAPAPTKAAPAPAPSGPATSPASKPASTPAQTKPASTAAPSAAPKPPTGALAPSFNVKLHYSGGGSKAQVGARAAGDKEIREVGESSTTAGATDVTVDGKMKFPSIVLENINTIKGVTCSKGLVVVSFNNQDAFLTSKLWPNNNFVLITTSAGGCAADGQRGLYLVKKIQYDDQKMTLSATADTTTFDKIMDNAHLQWEKKATDPKKNGLNFPINLDLSGAKIGESQTLSLMADVAKYSGNVGFSGELDFNFLAGKLNKMSADLNYNSLLALNLTASLTAKDAPITLHKFKPVEAKVAPFSIPGILDVGPILNFELGVEFGARGVIKMATGLRSEIKDSNVHIDFLDSKKSTATGWKPINSISAAKFSADVSLQISPYAALNVAMGVRAFGKLVDMSASVEAKPMLVNSFNAHDEAKASFSSSTGITFSSPKDKKCPGGGWFASTMQFSLLAKLGTLSYNLFSATSPVAESQCFTFPKI